jgi:hypothetical protein
MIRKAGAIFIVLAGVLGCEKISDDAVRPEITQYTLGADTVVPGDLLEISVGVADDEALSQMRVRINSSFSKSFGEWREVRVDDISGTSFQKIYQFVIPDSSMAGLYSAAFQVVDRRGNASIDSVLDFTIYQPGITPEIAGLETEPPANSELVIMADTAGFLRFMGEVNDAVGLAQVEIVFRRATGGTLDTETFPFVDTLVTNWSFTANVDTFFFSSFSAEPGSVVIRAINTDGHRTRRSFNFDFGF